MIERIVDSLKQEGWDKSGKLTFLVNQSSDSFFHNIDLLQKL